ncbi:hypothetical protein AK812_SmicGene729 [Symbiodinium microadriaticum]|uniref:Uncharacterized protein n=1 Tax=Symbiodinium microadriaticum TaxID=2951 RepID=A0A1Q9F625_SYMMI|nr:hypothetical protein AK812_SmicGene729 [Symbiodinium microadriaticum]
MRGTWFIVVLFSGPRERSHYVGWSVVSVAIQQAVSHMAFGLAGIRAEATAVVWSARWEGPSNVRPPAYCRAHTKLTSPADYFASVQRPLAEPQLVLSDSLT